MLHCTSSEAILEVYGIEYCSSLRSLRGTHEKLSIFGVLSTIAYTSRKLKLLTLNGRLLESPRIQQTIDSLLKNSLINVPSSGVKSKGKNSLCSSMKSLLLSNKNYYQFINTNVTTAMIFQFLGRTFSIMILPYYIHPLYVSMDRKTILVISDYFHPALV